MSGLAESKVNELNQVADLKQTEQNGEDQDRATSLPHFDSISPKRTGRRRKGSGGNILEFEHALHLLEENINDLCTRSGVKTHKLHSFQFIANLIELTTHLEAKQMSDSKEQMASDRKMLEKVQIVENYQALPSTRMTRLESDLSIQSVSQSSSPSFDCTFVNETSDILISPAVDSEHEEWDFVEFT